MRYWKYKIVNRVDIGTEENPLWHEAFFEKRIPYTEANEEVAKREAYNGEYEIYDDGKEEVTEPTKAEALDARLTYIEMMTGLLEV